MTLSAFMNLFAEFRDPSWDAWRGILARLTPEVREFFAIVGRGAGKSRIVALLACFVASRAYKRVPGEHVYVGVFAPDRKQAGVTFRYIVGLLKSVPALAGLIVAESKDSIELSNGVVVEVMTASIAAPRGRAYALAIVEEAAFLPTDSSANPDVELIRALRPALARVPGSLLAVVSSPYARKGILWDAWQKHHDSADSAVVLVQAPTTELNPSFDARAIATAYEEDPASADAEYGANFRTDVETFIVPEALEAVCMPGRFEQPYQAKHHGHYFGFLDPSGGTGQDSMTLGIAHHEDGRAVLDLVREVKPPFSPDATVTEFAAVLKTYRLTKATSDRYAGSWPVEAFRKAGITVEPSTRTKSEIYRDVLPLIMSGTCELLDHARLLKQLGGLERRTARGGKDSIDHAPRQHDDVANAAAGALVLASHQKPKEWYVAGTVDLSEPPSTPAETPGWIRERVREERMRIVNGNTPEEIARRDAEATAVMRARVGRPPIVELL